MASTSFAGRLFLDDRRPGDVRALVCATLRAERMFLFVRLVRALLVFGVIFASYVVQLALARVFGKLPPGRSAILGRELPPWLARRRKRVDEKNAKRMLRGMLRLRGVFIKLGQVLSIMGGFLPRAYTRELEQLQDSVPPHPFSDLVAACEESFGKPPSAIFRDIDETPLAAASLGQVHVAHLQDGRKVDSPSKTLDHMHVPDPVRDRIIRIEERLRRVARSAGIHDHDLGHETKGEDWGGENI